MVKQGLYDPRYEHDACGMGFIVNLNGEKSHDVIRKGIEILINLTHRGACGCDPETGDGAGILIQIPHEFFVRECSKLGFSLPEPGSYGIGMMFLPVEKQQRLICEGIVEKIAREEGLNDRSTRSALCLVHQRFSTNTFPTWPLAHPYRYICHNGEINTVRGNVNWMNARESVLASDQFGDDIKKIFPVIQPGNSDTG